MNKKRLLIASGILGIIIIGVVVVILALALPVGGPNPSSATTPGTPTATITASVSTTPPQRRIVGVVQSIGQHSFVLTVPYAKKPVTVTVDTTTMYATTGITSFGDIKVGDRVEVRGQFDAKTRTLAAVHIRMAPAAATTPTVTGSPTP